MKDAARDRRLPALAGVAAVSPRHPSRLFNEHAGMSIPDNLNGLHVALAAGSLSVKLRPY